MMSSARPMSPTERLIAAAEKIERHLSTAATIPWRSAEQTHDEWVSIQNNYVAIGSTFSGSDAAVAALAVNALPALAAWMRWEARTAVVPAHSHMALATADQILGDAR